MQDVWQRLKLLEFIQKKYGGSGILLSGTAGTPKARSCRAWWGVVGLNAAQIAVGIGADVTVLDINASRLSYLDQIFGMKDYNVSRFKGNIEKCLHDVVVVQYWFLVQKHRI